MRTIVWGVIAALGFTGVARAQLPAAKLTSVFPPGGQRGTSVEVTLGGSDLDDLTSLHFSNPSITAEPKVDAATGKPIANAFVVHVGSGVAPGAYDVRAIGRFGASNPRAFVVDAMPQSVPKATNTSPEAAADLPVNSGAYAVAVRPASQYFRVKLKHGQRVFVDSDAVEL